jgi:hypothetical protein
MTISYIDAFQLRYLSSRILFIDFHDSDCLVFTLDGEPSHLSTTQRKKYEFNANVVRRIHQLDAELTEAKTMYAEEIASTMADYEKTVQIANRIKTPSSSKKVDISTSNVNAHSSTIHRHEYSFQPNVLNSLRQSETYNEAYEEAVDPVGAIVPNKLMNIEQTPHKRAWDRRRFHKIFTLRTPKLRMFPK